MNKMNYNGDDWRALYIFESTIGSVQLRVHSINIEIEKEIAHKKKITNKANALWQVVWKGLTEPFSILSLSYCLIKNC